MKQKASVPILSRPSLPPKPAEKQRSTAPCCPEAAAQNGAGGVLWRMHGRHGVAYVQDMVLACALLKTDAKNVAKQAMAVYYNGKGKAIAYQIRFCTDEWKQVQAQLGIAEPPALPVPAAAKPVKRTANAPAKPAKQSALPATKPVKHVALPAAKPVKQAILTGAKPVKRAVNPAPQQPTLFVLPLTARVERPGQDPSPPTASKRTTAPPPRKRAG